MKGGIMNCVKCGKELKPDDKFCRECGTQVEEDKASQKKIAVWGCLISLLIFIIALAVIGNQRIKTSQNLPSQQKNILLLFQQLVTANCGKLMMIIYLL